VPFSVMFVCTGNVCRSPMAERLLRARLLPHAPVVCSSAGVAALSRRPMDPPSAAVLRELGGDPDGHVAKSLTVEQVVAADLVLTAEVSHRTAVLQAEPIAFRRVFTLLEFGRLGGGLRPPVLTKEQDLRARVDEVAQQRGIADTVGPGDDDIADPFGRSAQTAHATGLQISAAIDALLTVLALR
jgi:protein-tyrosine phosphatase